VNRLLIISRPDPYGTGGQRRSYYIIRELFKKKDLDLYLLIFGNEAIFHNVLDLGINKKNLLLIREMEKSSISYVYNTAYASATWDRIVQWIADVKPDLIVAHDETPWYMFLAYMAHRKAGFAFTTVIQLIPLGLNIFLPYIKTVKNPVERVKAHLKTLLWSPFFGSNLSTLLRSTIPLIVSKSLLFELKSIGVSLHKYIILDPPVGLNWEGIIGSAPDPNTNYDAIYMARLIPEKGLYDLLKILHYVKKDFGNIKVGIIGKFENRYVKARFLKLVEKYDLESNIKLLGYVAETTKFSLLKSANVFIYPSREDSFGIVVAEALACGLPVIAFDIPAMRYNFTTKAVIKVPIGDYKQYAEHIINLVNSDTERRMLSSEAVKFVARFRWDEAAVSELKAYRKVLDLSSRWALKG